MDNDNNQNEDQKTHYVCKSCGGVANNQKECETEDCTMKGQPLEECDCEDGQHGKSEEGDSDEE